MLGCVGLGFGGCVDGGGGGDERVCCEAVAWMCYPKHEHQLLDSITTQHHHIY